MLVVGVQTEVPKHLVGSFSNGFDIAVGFALDFDELADIVDSVESDIVLSDLVDSAVLPDRRRGLEAEVLDDASMWSPFSTPVSNSSRLFDSASRCRHLVGDFESSPRVARRSRNDSSVSAKSRWGAS